MKITDLTPDNDRAIEQAAKLLVDLLPEGWPTMDEALQEVREALPDDRIARIAVEGEDPDVLGWIGGLKLGYPGDVWELHPLVVREDRQQQGVGRALVAGLEERVRERGGKIVYLGTDDKRGQTSIADIDIFQGPLQLAANIENLRGHPYEFYQKQGYVIVGVMPDGNGWGRPDIFMAKRIAQR
ncbi:MAG: GNAT family N-acetyltransferase [Dehalococcoidia bacterium]